MSRSSILGGTRAPVRSPGHDTSALGPSDSSDSGSDVQNAHGFDALDAGAIGADRADLASDSDACGTGERGAAVHDIDIVEGADIAPDRIRVFAARGAPPDARALDDLDAVDLDALTADDDPGPDDASDDAD